MNLKISPIDKISATIDLPASKSYSIRAFFVALCGGRSHVIGVSDCDDARVAMRIAKALGSKIRKTDKGLVIDALGVGRFLSVLHIDVGESGTSLRFVLPLLPFHVRSAHVTGRGTLIGRPNQHLCKTLRACGLKIKGNGPKESVPISYDGGELSGGLVTIDGSVSSQFVSALMIASARSLKDTRLVMTGRLVSQDYVTMTRQILQRAGIRSVLKSSREFLIPGGQKFSGLKNFYVPSDYGLAAFWMVAAALLKSDIKLKGHFDDSLVQSDGAILGLLKKMGVQMTRTSHMICIKGPTTLKGGIFSLKDCPDLVPIMTIVAMFAKGTTRLVDIGHARVKESDRISDLREELLKVGADIEEKKDELIIQPRATYGGRAGASLPVLDPHHDHRLAMAFAVLGLKVGLIVKDVECTSKSYPGFVRSFRCLARAAAD
ncbi:MAG: 3-phosphoshikimate 1-carboxyvinyltransferase [Candidatus Omnitrophica bacterium]|nr:3-phosphoshikimate 1-carboxyvinyltransferase [Candidatus Omnitrophota bacterium]